MKYGCNHIVKLFRVGFIWYANLVVEMHDLAKYLPPLSIKGDRYEASNWKVRDQEFTISEIRVAIKDGLPSSMQDELDDHHEDYR